MEQNKNKQNNEIFDNIKTLSQIVGNKTVTILSANVRRVKDEVDAYLKTVREREREYTAKKQKMEQTKISIEASAVVSAVKSAEPKPAEVKPAVAPVQKADTQPARNNNQQRPQGNRQPFNSRGQMGQQQQGQRFGNRPFNNGNNNNGFRNPNGQRPFNPNFNRNGGNGFNKFGDRPYNPNFSVNRPNGNKPFGQKPFGAKPVRPIALEKPPVAEPTRNFANKGKSKQYDEKKTYDKRTLLRRGLIEEANIEDRMLTRKYKVKKRVEEPKSPKEVVAPTSAVITTNNITVKSLSEIISKPVSEIIKKFMLLGMMVTINSNIDFDAAELVANELGIKLEQKLEKTSEEKLTEIQTNIKAYDDSEAVVRPPIVTIMGHVDHGKTTLLDYIRKTNVAGGEAGGITQSIGAYQVKSGDSYITFIDTPGHEAFTAMRMRGAMVTDIAVLIVAADDGIMPQTVEAIRQIKTAKVPMIVAINKMDKPAADPDRIMQQLTEYDVLPEEWGGDTIVVKISAATGKGIDKLLEMISLVAEMQQLKANPKVNAIGTIIEADLEKGRGAMASLIVKDGTLHKGDTIVAGTTYCKVKTMMDENGKIVKEATPSMPVRVVGFDEVPNAGDVFTAVDEKLVKEIIQERKDKIKKEMTKSTSATSLEEMMNQISMAQAKVQNVIIKADVNGSLEAIKQSFNKLSNDKTRINIISTGVGPVFETDVVLAQASKSLVVAFNTKIDSKAKNIADKEHVQIKSYKIIYEAIEDMEKMLKGLLDPTYSEQKLGYAEVLKVFKLSTSGLVAGSSVKDGKIVRNEKARILRNGKVLAENLTISSVKIVKDDVKEAGKGFECGIKVDGFTDIQEGDTIECYTLVRDEV